MKILIDSSMLFVSFKLKGYLKNENFRIPFLELWNITYFFSGFKLF